MPEISETAIIGEGVTFSGRVRVEAYCLVGVGEGETKTTFLDDVVLRAGTIVYPGNQIGRGLRTGNRANIRENNIIGDDVSIGTMTVVEHHVRMGNRVRIHSQAFIPEYTTIEEDVWIGPNVVITNSRYPASTKAKQNLAGCRLCKGCRVGANSTILPGLIIGEGALIGAGSLIAHNVPPGELWLGSPARFLRRVSEIKDYE